MKREEISNKVVRKNKMRKLKTNGKYEASVKELSSKMCLFSPCVQLNKNPK